MIELKLASGLSATHRMRDLADVQDLIIALNLPLELKDELDISVRPEYQRIWEAANKDPPTLIGFYLFTGSRFHHFKFLRK